jgi:hypothetical protein
MSGWGERRSIQARAKVRIQRVEPSAESGPERINRGLILASCRLEPPRRKQAEAEIKGDFANLPLAVPAAFPTLQRGYYPPRVDQEL